jgi:thioredoxin reductase (NADPH)
MDTLIAFLVAAALTLFFLRKHFKGLKERDVKAREAAEKGKLFSEGPKAQHPHIDTIYCIGCATCTTVCPEGDVLAMLAGKAVIVNGYKCIGHSLCADACPVGAITMVMASPSMGGDMPTLTGELETTVPNLFIVGELGGLALIKNAVNQGRDCIDTIVNRFAARGVARTQTDVYDVVIIGAGPAGIAASLQAIHHKLRYLTLERDEIGGTVAKYPRQKLVMTSPVEFPMYGKFKKTELSKEALLAFWDKILHRADFKVRTGQRVEDIKRGPDGVFTIHTQDSQYRSYAVILALGRTGTPRKLGVKGEELSKVMYRLIEADHYVNKRILVIGGGDSAVEAAMGLAHQVGNQVTLSYRSAQFSRIKERNATRIADCIKSGKVQVLFSSNPVEFKEQSVVIEVGGQQQELPNDYVWIFAGGIPPNDFLKKIGVGFGARDMTQDASAEAKQEAASKKAREAGPRPVTEPISAKLRPASQLGIPGEELPKVAYQLDDAAKYSDNDILIIGGGDSAIHAAIALSHAQRNRVTLSYRGDHFQRSPQRNQQLIETAEREKKIRILRKCAVAAITQDSVILDVDGNPAEIPNDKVFILLDGDAAVEFESTDEAAALK